VYEPKIQSCRQNDSALDRTNVMKPRSSEPKAACCDLSFGKGRLGYQASPRALAMTRAYLHRRAAKELADSFMNFVGLSQSSSPFDECVPQY
jgi:hypothetical protein